MGCSERSRGGGRAGMQSIKGSHVHGAHIMHSYTVIFTHVLSPHTEGGDALWSRDIGPKLR